MTLGSTVAGWAREKYGSAGAGKRLTLILALRVPYALP
jgi:hypothetical protein